MLNQLNEFDILVPHMAQLFNEEIVLSYKLVIGGVKPYSSSRCWCQQQHRKSNYRFSQ
jgi:hypothetical protein